MALDTPSSSYTIANNTYHSTLPNGNQSATNVAPSCLSSSKLSAIIRTPVIAGPSIPTILMRTFENAASRIQCNTRHEITV